MTPEQSHPHHQVAREGEADCVTGEPPHGDGHCTLRQLPTAALAPPVALSTHSLRARLHSVGSSRESTYVHSCGEQLSTSEPPGFLDPVPMLLAPNGAEPHSS